MTNTILNSLLATQTWLQVADLKRIIVEPFLVVGTAAFWALALPFIAFTLMLVKVWDTVAALVSGSIGQTNPLILRRGATKGVFLGRRSTVVS